MIIKVYPPEKNCGRLSSDKGIEACKVVQKLEGKCYQFYNFLYNFLQVVFAKIMAMILHW